MNTNKTIRFALYDNCGNLVCDFDSLEDLLEDHVEFLKDFDDYEYDINNTKITGPMASYQYADKVLKGWEIRKIEDGEEVGFYVWNDDCNDTAFTELEKATIDHTLRKAIEVVASNIRKEWCPSEWDEDKRKKAPIYKASFLSDGEMETGIESVTFEEALSFAQTNEAFRKKALDEADGVIKISYDERGEDKEEDTIFIEEE